MLIFKPTYNMDAIEQDVKKIMFDKVTARLADKAIKELEQEQQSRSANTVEVAN